MLGCWMRGQKPCSGPPSRKRHEECVTEPLTFLETWPIMVAVATGISLGGGNLRYRALIALSIPSVLVVSAARSGTSVDARRTSLADELDRASDVGGGAWATTITGKGQGFTVTPCPRGGGSIAHEQAR
jgi:hypothetical protein